MSAAGGARTPIRQNQDSRDYGIFRTLPARVFDRLWRKGRDWRDEILKIPRIPILTKTLACAAAPISARHSSSLPPSFSFSPPAIPVLYPHHSRSLPPSFPRKRESTNQQRHPRERGDKRGVSGGVRRVRTPSSRTWGQARCPKPSPQIAAIGTPLPLRAYRGRF